MMSADEFWDPWHLQGVNNFTNHDWTNYFDPQEKSFREILEEETFPDLNPDSLSNKKTFKWKNYFDNDPDPSAKPAFQDLLTQTFEWKDYFNPDDVNFPEMDAFPSKIDWIQWDNLAVESLQWNTFPELPKWLPDISSDEGSRLHEKNDSRTQSDSLGGSNALTSESEDSNPQNLQKAPAISSEPQARPTFLTAKHYDWQTQIFSKAVAKFRKNIHDTRDTRSAGSEPISLNPPEIIESHCSSPTESIRSNSPEILTAHTDDDHHELHSSKNDLASLPEIHEPDTNIFSSNITTPNFSPDMPMTISLPKLLDPIKTANQYRPHSSEGLYLKEPSPFGHYCLLQVPPTHCQGRRTSEPCLPKLPPPRRLKTPLGLIDDSKFWAVKNKREPWDHFDKPILSKSQLKKLKKLPSRCRSAMDKPTCFDIDDLVGSNAKLIQSSPKRSLKRSIKEFRFRKNNCRVTPEPINFPYFLTNTQKGIHSKIKSIKPKNRSRKAKVSLFKRREWVPVIRHILKSSIRRIGTSVKVSAVPNNSQRNASPYSSPRKHSQNNFMHFDNNNPSEQYRLIKYNNFIQTNGNGGGQTKSSLNRRRPYWLRFLRYCNIPQQFGIHPWRKNHPQGNRVCKFKK